MLTLVVAMGLRSLCLQRGLSLALQFKFSWHRPRVAAVLTVLVPGHTACWDSRADTDAKAEGSVVKGKAPWNRASLPAGHRPPPSSEETTWTVRGKEREHVRSSLLLPA